jgi:hypothetical protein
MRQELAHGEFVVDYEKAGHCEILEDRSKKKLI